MLSVTDCVPYKPAHENQDDMDVKVECFEPKNMCTFHATAVQTHHMKVETSQRKEAVRLQASTMMVSDFVPRCFKISSRVIIKYGCDI